VTSSWFLIPHWTTMHGQPHINVGVVLSVLKCFNWKLYRCICWLIAEVTSHCIMSLYIKIPSLCNEIAYFIQSITFFFSLRTTACSIQLQFPLFLLSISLAWIFFSLSSLYVLRFLILLYALTTFLAFLFTSFFFYLLPYFCHSLCNITHVIKFLFFHYVELILQTLNYIWAQLPNYILQYNCLQYKVINFIWNWNNNINWILIVDIAATQLHLTLYIKHMRKWNILFEISKRKANWIRHILCRNCLLQQVIEGKIKGGMEVKYINDSGL